MGAALGSAETGDKIMPSDCVYSLLREWKKIDYQSRVEVCSSIRVELKDMARGVELALDVVCKELDEFNPLTAVNCRSCGKAYRYFELEDSAGNCAECVLLAGV